MDIRMHIQGVRIPTYCGCRNWKLSANSRARRPQGFTLASTSTSLLIQIKARIESKKPISKQIRVPCQSLQGYDTKFKTLLVRKVHGYEAICHRFPRHSDRGPRECFCTQRSDPRGAGTTLGNYRQESRGSRL